ncbi:hypothetical protein JOS77_23250 [Chromobacterium haemolyticum]|nr:hypothetical protein JOS77_23250 [Chromobacterium haemolyticum]
MLNQLSRQQAPPDAAQRDELYAHPIVGSAILREAGVVDEHWHLLVQTHQEQRGGDGYPQGLRGEDIHPDAALLHMVDVLCSCIHQPQPALPALVIGSLYRGELGDFDPQHAALLVKELGVYPPGSFVKLASNEIGVVTHRSDKANAPRVAALRKLDGAPYARRVAPRHPAERLPGAGSGAVVGGGGEAGLSVQAVAEVSGFRVEPRPAVAVECRIHP